MVSAEDMEKIEKCLQADVIDISCAKKIGDQYILSVIGIAELFSRTNLSGTATMWLVSTAKGNQ